MADDLGKKFTDLKSPNQASFLITSSNNVRITQATIITQSKLYYQKLLADFVQLGFKYNEGLASDPTPNLGMLTRYESHTYPGITLLIRTGRISGNSEEFTQYTITLSKAEPQKS